MARQYRRYDQWFYGATRVIEIHDNISIHDSITAFTNAVNPHIIVPCAHREVFDVGYCALIPWHVEHIPFIRRENTAYCCCCINTSPYAINFIEKSLFKMLIWKAPNLFFRRLNSLGFLLLEKLSILTVLFKSRLLLVLIPQKNYTQ